MVWEDFQVSVSIRDWSFTPGQVSVRFRPATATTFLRGIFSTSESDKIQKKGYKHAFLESSKL